MRGAVDRLGGRAGAGRGPGSDGDGVVRSAPEGLQYSLHAAGATRFRLAL